MGADGGGVGGGYTARYVGTCVRRYLSVFGEITILRAHYARQGRPGLFPLDARFRSARFVSSELDEFSDG